MTSGEVMTARGSFAVRAASMVALALAAPPALAQGAPDLRTHRCIEVQIGGEKAFDCANEQFKREVERVNPSLNAPPISAGSQDLRTGVANIPAVRQQYGPNFGRSTVPYRPGTTFSSPLRR